MKFGIFDHVDASGLAPSEHYAARLRLLEAIDALAFHSYHVAEHHGTPLGLAPSPNVYLSAVSQRTRRLLFGPMVYVAALYHPLRLAEEICMLDHLSNGRLQVGLGRGAVWIEHELYGVERARVPQRYAEALDVLLQALTSDRVDFAGEHFRFRNVGIVMRPLQRPHPPLWYGIANPDSTVWAAAHDVNVVSLMPLAGAAKCLSRYREEWAKLGKAESALPAVGLMRHVVVAETDSDAERIARSAFRHWRASFTNLWERSGVPFPLEHILTREWDGYVRNGLAVAGSPATVREFLAAQIKEAGANLVLGQMIFGNMREEEALHSLRLFSRDVIPSFKAA
ncbi:MAG TPA: LLM class flavin-dependent oxidoreductase [Steroidobacteraceae bacterium]|nr:LLM class flavin-dependent oxidoreductase [Steroidobacteraceae bacterium]